MPAARTHGAENAAKMEPQGGGSGQLPSIGERVVDGNGFRATVRYVGPVCTAKDPTSLWIGEHERREGGGELLRYHMTPIQR